MISVDFTTRVIYAETDMMGRVYYGRFFEYFEAVSASLADALIGLELTEYPHFLKANELFAFLSFQR